MKRITLFPVAGVKNTSQCMNTVLTMATEWQQTWMATEKCYSQKLLKAKLTTSK